MTDEWVEKRVADLEVGDEVRDYGEVTHLTPTSRPYEAFICFGSLLARYMPRGARVDVRRPPQITIESNVSPHRSDIYIAGRYIGTLCKDHAEEYAERLRNSAEERAKALGR